MQPTLAPAPHPSMQTSAQDHADQGKLLPLDPVLELSRYMSYGDRRVAGIDSTGASVDGQLRQPSYLDLRDPDANATSVPVLHDQLLAAHQHMSHPQQPRPQPQTAPPPHMQPNITSPRDQNNIDPAISGATMLSGPPQTPPQPEPTSQESPKTYGKRPLSTSKRAAQNRAAQRAFRQRKESYIRKLEEQVKEFDGMSETLKALQAENYQLREHIINLQSRLLDSQGEIPELPGNIDLSQPRADLSLPGTGPAPTGAPAQAPPGPPQQPQAQTQASAPNDDMNSLNRIAVAGLGMRKHPNEEANFLGNNFQARRPRADEGQPDASDVPKTEMSHGLPVVS